MLRAWLDLLLIEARGATPHGRGLPAPAWEGEAPAEPQRSRAGKFTFPEGLDREGKGDRAEAAEP
jgi:hypothetical protein